MTEPGPGSSEHADDGVLRRNLTAGTNLNRLHEQPDPDSPTFRIRRNISTSTLTELRRREQQCVDSTVSAGSRRLVIEAVTYQLLTHALGREAAESEMINGPSAADQEAKRDISAMMQQYITTIVRQLELPNSCIVAALIYIERAVGNKKFSLSLQNWQPYAPLSFIFSADSIHALELARRTFTPSSHSPATSTHARRDMHTSKLVRSSLFIAHNAHTRPPLTPSPLLPSNVPFIPYLLVASAAAACSPPSSSPRSSPSTSLSGTRILSKLSASRTCKSLKSLDGKPTSFS